MHAYHLFQLPIVVRIFKPYICIANYLLILLDILTCMVYISLLLYVYLASSTHQAYYGADHPIVSALAYS